MSAVRRCAPLFASLVLGSPVLMQTSRPEAAPAATTTAAKATKPIASKPIAVAARPTITVKSPSILLVRGAQRARSSTSRWSSKATSPTTRYPWSSTIWRGWLFDMPLPEEAYVPIGGKVPKTLRRGDKVKVTATLVSGTQLGGALAREPTAIRIDDATQLQVVTAAAVAKPIAIAKLQVALAVSASKYAVLIAGGANAGSSYARYWNDLSAMYGLLRNKGYAATTSTWSTRAARHAMRRCR